MSSTILVNPDPDDFSIDNLKKILKDPGALNAVRDYFVSKTNPQKPDTWEVCTLSDAHNNTENENFLVHGLIPCPGVIAIVGMPKVCKSLLASDLAMSISMGESWLSSSNGNPLFPEVKQSRVMWCDFDNGPIRTHQRFKALSVAKNIPVDAPFYYYSMPQPTLNASDPSSINDMVQRAKDKEIKFLVLDNLGTISGGVDENGSGMIDVLSNLRLLSEGIKGTVCIIHHQRKGSGSSHSNKSESVRGHSSIGAALDLALLMERKTGSDIVTISAINTRDHGINPFSAQFVYTNDENHVLTTAKFEKHDGVRCNMNTYLESEILKLVHEGDYNKNHLVNQVKDKYPNVGINKIREIIDMMVSEGQIQMKRGNKKDGNHYAPIKE